MDRITDPRLVEILTTRQESSLPAELVGPAYRLARLLLAAHQWRDVSVFAQPFHHADGYAIPVTGKWIIAFNWVPGSGVRDLALLRI